MSDRAGPQSLPMPMLLVGATGLVGKAVIAATAGAANVQLAALARRETPLATGARLEMLIAAPADWPAAIARARPAVMIIALGTTLATVGGDRAAFRAVDHDLVVAVARAARAAGTQQLIVVSSVGADAASRNFYLAVKGEAETALVALGFARLDILRPGLLLGWRGGALRLGETIGQIVAPVTDLLLHGRMARLRAVRAYDVAAAILALAGAPGRGRHVHYGPDIRQLAQQR